MKRTTDFRELLAGRISKSYIDDIVNTVHNYPEDFQKIYNLMDDPERKVSWRAAWACEKISKSDPHLFKGWEANIISRLLKANHDGMKRLFLTTLCNLPPPAQISVELLDYCFNHMLDLQESAGVQSVSIRLAYKLCLVEPELLYELKIYLENAEPEYYSTGVKTAIKNTLKRID